MSVTAKRSLRWTLICDGAVREYPDGRQVCCDTAKGRIEYRRRIAVMAMRQHGICGLGAHLLRDETFEHSAGRGFDSSHRDDRISDEDGNKINCAACLDCNLRKGSVRI